MFVKLEFAHRVLFVRKCGGQIRMAKSAVANLPTPAERYMAQEYRKFNVTQARVRRTLDVPINEPTVDQVGMVVAGALQYLSPVQTDHSQHVVEHAQAHNAADHPHGPFLEDVIANSGHRKISMNTRMSKLALL